MSLPSLTITTIRQGQFLLAALVVLLMSEAVSAQQVLWPATRLPVTALDQTEDVPTRLPVIQEAQARPTPISSPLSNASPLPHSTFDVPSVRLSSVEFDSGPEQLHFDLEVSQDSEPQREYFVLDSQPPLPGESPHDNPDDPPRSVRREIEILKQRLKEMETGLTAREDATREVIRKTFAEKGSNINDMVIFGGGIETTVGWFDDFGDIADDDGFSESDIFLSAVELDFEVQVSPWVTGYLVLEYREDFDVLFPTAAGFGPIDRISVDVAYVTIGDPLMCWPYVTLGRVVAPFGISTGARLGDVLTVEGPLTTDIFELREDVLMFGFEAPTPPPPPPPSTASIQPPPQGTVWPIVKPKLFRPLINRFARRHCRGVYCGAAPPPPTPQPTLPPPCLPPFTGAIYFYNGETFRGERTGLTLANGLPEFLQGEDHIEHLGATLGYRTRGCCQALGWPWSIDMDVDFNSSAFDSNYLQFEYQPFLADIGYVPAMATHVKSTLGPFSFIAEWNGTLDDAEFTAFEWDSDPAINPAAAPIAGDFAIQPQAWAIALGYQFDWNAGVQEIGGQGTYFAITYSQSRGMGGVLNEDGDRVGFVPRERLSVGIGEWVFDGLRVALEYSYVTDYRRNIRTGATGRTANAWFTTVTYEW